MPILFYLLRLVSCVSVFCVGCCSQSWGNTGNPTSPNLQIYALQYGRSWFRSQNVVAKPLPQKFVPFAWLFYLVVTPTRKILLDTGFTQSSYIRSFGIRDYESPDRVLARLGFKATDITDVIVTHEHFDHAGGLPLFAKARIYLHPYSYRVLRSSRTLPTVRHFLRSLANTRQIVLVKQSLQLLPNLRIIHIGGHTPGSMIVELQQQNIVYVFVGDECYLQMACQRGWHLSRRSASHIRNNQTFLKRFQQRDGLQRIPLTGHDPAIMQQYPLVTRGIVCIYREGKGRRK